MESDSDEEALIYFAAGMIVAAVLIYFVNLAMGA